MVGQFGLFEIGQVVVQEGPQSRFIAANHAPYHFSPL